VKEPQSAAPKKSSNAGVLKALSFVAFIIAAVYKEEDLAQGDLP
jgi:hypothetical protein